MRLSYHCSFLATRLLLVLMVSEAYQLFWVPHCMYCFFSYVVSIVTVYRKTGHNAVNINYELHHFFVTYVIHYQKKFFCTNHKISCFSNYW